MNIYQFSFSCFKNLSVLGLICFKNMTFINCGNYVLQLILCDVSFLWFVNLSLSSSSQPISRLNKWIKSWKILKYQTENNKGQEAYRTNLCKIPWKLEPLASPNTAEEWDLWNVLLYREKQETWSLCECKGNRFLH